MGGDTEREEGNPSRRDTPVERAGRLDVEVGGEGIEVGETRVGDAALVVTDFFCDFFGLVGM